MDNKIKDTVRSTSNVYLKCSYTIGIELATYFSSTSYGTTSTSDFGQFNSLKFKKSKDFGDFQILSNSPEKAPSGPKKSSISKKPKMVEHIDV